jgi:protein-S-isoprenylcysteine O-methyltransferase Ste14
MNAALAELFLIAFGLVGLLPMLFFRRGGRFNARWWLTAAPFFLCAVLLVLALAGVLAPWVAPASALGEALALLATPLAAASIALVALTVGSHDQRVALWHQPDQLPDALVTRKAYRRLRHPFYLAFMLAFAGISLFLPHPLVWAAAAYGVIALHLTARDEERRLLASPLGPQYREYMTRTNRFLPRGGHIR